MEVRNLCFYMSVVFKFDRINKNIAKFGENSGPQTQKA